MWHSSLAPWYLTKGTEHIYWHKKLCTDVYNNCIHNCQKLETRCPLEGGSEDKASACNAGDLGSIPGLGRSPGEGNGNPLQYSCLENPMDRGAWWATVHGVTKSQTRLSKFTFFHCLEGEWINKLVYPEDRILFSIKMIWAIKPWKDLERTLLCLLLSERSQSEKATYCMTPTMWHSGKGKTKEIVKRWVV